MLFGPYSWLFWTFQIALGAIVPLIILLHPKLKLSTIPIVAASILVVFGIFIKRFYLVIVGLAYPQEYYTGDIEGIHGQIGSFRLMPTETIMSIGICAFLALIFILGLKFLDLLPAKSAIDPVPEEIQPVSLKTSSEEMGNSSSTEEESAQVED
jgi:molybdopterin-containing oxidoreductase family membrane subunit